MTAQQKATYRKSMERGNQMDQMVPARLGQGDEYTFKHE
jgi:hypothetical protein